MKKMILSIILLSSSLYADLTMQQIQKMVYKIHEKRNGITLKELESTKEPFMHLEVENNKTIYLLPKKIKTKLVLHSILNNKAYINDRWISIDEKIMGYQLKYIGKNGVVLRNKNMIEKLFLHKNKKNYILVKEKE